MQHKCDYKKEFRDLYVPTSAPTLVEVPSMNFIAVDGKGNPNPANSEFAAAVEMLYTLSFTIKMSKMGAHHIEGYFEYVVPPLEGLWWTADNSPIDNNAKEKFCWRLMIRQPEFVDSEVFEWAVREAREKKKADCSAASFITLDEGLCAQAMHIGLYDQEVATREKIERFMADNGLKDDIWERRRHHEIYLSDPRRTAPERNRTVVRIPVRHIIQPLETERLLLRECLVSDADDMYEYSRDENVGPNAGWAPHKSIDETVEVIRTIFAAGYVWAMVDKATGRVIGSLGLHSGRLGSGRMEFGYAMSRDYWGRGLMSEAAREVLRYGFENVGLTRIECGCFPFNDRSRRVIEKSGFKFEERVDGSFVRYDGEMLDELRYSLTKEEFDKTRGRDYSDCRS